MTTMLVTLIVGDPESILPSTMNRNIAVRMEPIMEVIAHNVNGAGNLSMVAA